MTDITSHIDIRQEVHLDLDDAVALTGLAASALHIEREAARLITARLGFRQTRKPVADRREGARIGCRVGTRRTTNRRLVDIDHLVEELQSLNTVMLSRMLT